MQGMSLHFRTIFVESFTTSRNKTTSKQVYTLSADIFGILELAASCLARKIDFRARSLDSDIDREILKCRQVYLYAPRF